MRISKNKMSRIAAIVTGVMLLSLSFGVQADVARRTERIITMLDGKIASDTGVNETGIIIHFLERGE